MIKWFTLFWLSHDEIQMLACAFLYLFNCRSRAHYDWKLVSDITLIMYKRFVKCILFMTSRTDFHQILFCWIGYTLQCWKWVYWAPKMVSGKRSHGDKHGQWNKRYLGRIDATCSSFRDEMFIKVKGTSVISLHTIEIVYHFACYNITNTNPD